ncbi:MAG: phospholipid/cholesterol/gamma-HCH transport system substrate-binding protein [Gammaproteobacteria bacterium]|jgi:phospholipid/cholesterol/gamma-HCH transport system substrate-binding protein
MSDKQSKIEFGVGVFMVFGLIAISFIAIRLGDLSMFGKDQYEVIARFTSASGLRTGAYVEAAGVRVGEIDNIVFDTEDYYAIVTLNIDNGVMISEDAIASVRTAGIIGDKFVKLTAGGSDVYLTDGMEIYETEPSINLEELISKYIFESGE